MKVRKAEKENIHTIRSIVTYHSSLIVRLQDSIIVFQFIVLTRYKQSKENRESQLMFYETYYSIVILHCRYYYTTTVGVHVASRVAGGRRALAHEDYNVHVGRQ